MRLVTVLLLLFLLVLQTTTLVCSQPFWPHEIVHVGCFGLNDYNQCGFSSKWWDDRNLTIGKSVGTELEKPSIAWDPLEEAAITTDFGLVHAVFGFFGRSYFVFGTNGIVFESGRMRPSLTMSCTNYTSEGAEIANWYKETEFVSQYPSVNFGISQLNVDRMFGKNEITFVLTKSGDLYVSGRNDAGQLGLGYANDSQANFTNVVTEPVNETLDEEITIECLWYLDWVDFTLLSGGWNITIEDVVIVGWFPFTFVIGNTRDENATRQVYCFGYNENFIHQSGTQGWVMTPTIHTFFSQETDDSLGYLSKLRCGEDHCVALINNSTHTRVFVLGNDGMYGVLGLGTQQASGFPPQPLIVLDSAEIVDIAAGNYFTLALGKNGSVWKWGYVWSMDGSGMESVSEPTLLTFPLEDEVIVEKMVAGQDFAFFLSSEFNDTTNETRPLIWGWGFNDAGQLGYINYTDPTIGYGTPIELTSIDEAWYNLSLKVAVDWADGSPLLTFISSNSHNMVVWKEHEKVNCTHMNCGTHGYPEPYAPCDLCRCNAGWIVNTTTKLCDVCDINRPLCQKHGVVDEVECRCQCDLLYFGRYCDTQISEVISRGTQMAVYYTNQAFFAVSTVCVSFTSIVSVIPGIAPFAQVFIRLVVGMMEQFQFIALIGRTGVELGNTFELFSSFFGFSLITVPIKSPSDLLGDFQHLFNSTAAAATSHTLRQELLNGAGFTEQHPLDTQNVIDTYSDIYGVTDDYLFLFSYLGIAILLVCILIVYAVTALINIKKMRTPAERKKIKHKLINSIIRVILLAYNGLALTASFQLTKVFNVWLLPLVLIAVLTLAALIGFDVFVLVILVRNKLKDSLGKTKTLRRLGALYEDMQESLFWFMVVIIARKFLIGVITGSLSEFPPVQSTLLFGVQFIFTLSLVIYRPYQDKFRCILEIFVSVVQTVCYGLIIVALPGLWVLQLGDAIPSIVSPILIVLTISSSVLYTAGIILFKIVAYIFGKKRIDDAVVEKEML